MVSLRRLLGEGLNAFNQCPARRTLLPGWRGGIDSDTNIFRSFPFIDPGKHAMHVSQSKVFS